MPPKSNLAVRLGLVLLAAGLGCSKAKPQAVEVGHHRLRFVLPKGWEHLDHGRQQLFRNGEAQISLVDLGPGTRDGMVRELREAESLWRAGRRRDAFQRVRELRSPALRFAPSGQRADFWKPWTDVTYIPDHAESSAIGPAFEALIAGTAMFEEVTPQRMLDYVLLLSTDMRRREIGFRDQRAIQGSDWIEAETWDHVSHLTRSRVAFLENDGYLLALSTDHGLLEQTGPAFEALLNSIEVTAGAPEAP